MNFKKADSPYRQNLPFYLAAILLLFLGKYFYSRAGSDDLLWILRPTAGWVQLLSGIPFVYVEDFGYVNHDLKILIAASCSGVQFLLIAAVTFIFSYVQKAQKWDWGFCRRQVSSWKKGVCWIIFSILLSYLCTILVNGLRIIAAIYLPLLFDRLGLWSAWLTPQRLHTAIGVVVYFSALLSLHRLVGRLFQKASSASSVSRQAGPPVFWYFAIVLGIPALNNALGKDSEAFGEFALLITFCCGAVLALFLLAAAGRKLFRSAQAAASYTPPSDD